jgi:UDP-N-acetylmuramoylalanine--D-glutamate ligase
MTLGRVLVLGLARSGQAAQAALEARGVEVVTADRTLGNDSELALVDAVDVLVKSPGVPGEAALVSEARRRGIPVWSEIELASRLLENPIVGVTGTNGKTTTTELLGTMLDAPTAGNVGTALSELVGVVAAAQPIVCELSSFQLEDVSTLRPRVAVLTNLEPDHLDRHGTFERYGAIKLTLFERQHEDDVAVVPRGFGPVPGDGRRVEFAADDPLPAEPRIRGEHNRANAAAATAAARAVGVPDEAIARALASFPGVEHRIEEVGELDGVLFVNDSKATNADSTEKALASFDRILWILGGKPKEGGIESLRAYFPKVDRAYLIGEAADAFAGTLEGEAPYVHCATLDKAVQAATEDAARSTADEPVVLLSPACASYDQFKNFEERGNRFRGLVRALPGIAVKEL